MPQTLWPVATYAPSMPGTRPISGSPSWVTGRWQACRTRIRLRSRVGDSRAQHQLEPFDRDRVRRDAGGVGRQGGPLGEGRDVGGPVGAREHLGRQHGARVLLVLDEQRP
jgi:hypothetical protein